MIFCLHVSAEPVSGIEDDAKDLLGEHQFTPEGATDAVTFQVTRGDYSKLLERTCENLRKAKVCHLEITIKQIYYNKENQYFKLVILHQLIFHA